MSDYGFAFNLAFGANRSGWWGQNQQKSNPYRYYKQLEAETKVLEETIDSDQIENIQNKKPGQQGYVVSLQDQIQ